MRFISRLQAILPIFGLGVLLIAGCGENTTSDHEGHNHETATTETDSEGMAESTRKMVLTKIFHAAPSPMETASLIKRSGATFHSDALNSTNRSSGYTTSDVQAINLGIYGADLSYATIFEENAASMDYLSAIRDLSRSLGVSEILNDEVMSDVEANRNDRDALIDIVSDTFYDLNERLKYNGQEDLAGLVVASGWIEGLYLATRHLNEAPEELKLRITEQKLTLNDVMRLCRSYEGTAELTALLSAMAPIEEAFAKVGSTEGESTTTREESGSFVIGGGPTFTADDATIQEIADAVEQVRNACIQ